MKIYTTTGDGIDALRLRETETPRPQADEILVKTKAVSVNYRDLLVIKGIEHWKPSAPRIPFSDGVGEVVAVGDKVSRVKIGERVAGIFLPDWIDGELMAAKNSGSLGGAGTDGVLAEYRVFSEEPVVKVPAYLSDEEAATLPVAAITAWHAVARRERIKTGETVLIEGTGGVSLFALQFAAALGARPIVISSSDEKLERTKDLGATAAINYKIFPNWDEKILEMTGGKGVDRVIETVGGANLNKSLNAVKISGVISFIGLIAGLSAPIETYKFVMKNVSIYGIETGSREMFEEMNGFIEEHRIKPVIDRVFNLNEIKDALNYLESGAHFGKVTVKF